MSVFRACCTVQAAVGQADAGQVDAAMVVLDHEQHVQSAQEDVDVEEVNRGDLLGLGGQELPPTGGCAPWGPFRWP
jgi:hypothetical protein